MNCPKCNKPMTGVQYGHYYSKVDTEYGGHPEHYDGVSEWRCDDCKYREGRWTKKELVDNEFEKRFGGDKDER